MQSPPQYAGQYKHLILMILLGVLVHVAEFFMMEDDESNRVILSVYIYFACDYYPMKELLACERVNSHKHKHRYANKHGRGDGGGAGRSKRGSKRKGE